MKVKAKLFKDNKVIIEIKNIDDLNKIDEVLK